MTDVNIMKKTVNASNLELSRLVNEQKDGIYGILPYSMSFLKLYLKKPYYSTPEAGIYSFGIIMAEVALYADQAYFKPDEEELMFGIFCGRRLSFPKEIPNYYRDIMERCWNHDTGTHPKVHKVKPINCLGSMAP